MNAATADPRRARGLSLALQVLEAERRVLFEDPTRVGLSPPHSAVPFTVQVAFRIHLGRELRLDGVACLYELDLGSPWFIVVAHSQALVLLFSRSGGLWLAGQLSAHGICWQEPGARNWF